MKGKYTLALAVIAFALPAGAQTVTVDDLACVPLQPHDAGKNHALVTGQVQPEPAGAEVRLYFRRMHHEVEDFYYTVMQPAGNGNFWGVLPDPEDHEIVRQELADGQSTSTEWADWWRAKDASDDRDPNGDLDTDVIRERAQVGRRETRSWLAEISDADLQAFLADQKSEPVEYFAAVYSPAGDRLAASEMKMASVREDCRATLDTQQIGEASNQTIGETASWQQDLALFHWECDHIVTRIDITGVKNADSVCRACVVAVVPFWIPATVAGAALAGVVSEPEDPVSPSQPQ